MNTVRKFPGHFAGAFISRPGTNGLVEVLVIGVLPIQYRGADKNLQLQKVQWKMPGGCAQDYTENENLSLALERELRYEIAQGQNLHVEIGEKIFKRVKPGRSPGSSHRQEFFYVQEVPDDDLRIEDKVEDEGDEILSPPLWLEARKFLKVVFFSHREPLVAGLEYLARSSSEIAFQYMDIIETYRHGHGV